MSPESADKPSEPTTFEFYLTDGSVAEAGISFTLTPPCPLDEPARRFRRLGTLSISA